MSLKKDSLYYEHKKFNAGQNLKALIVDYAGSSSTMQENIMNVLNIVKTSSVISYTYTQCLTEIKDNYPNINMPDNIINAIVMSHIGDEPTKKINIESYSVDVELVNSWDEWYYNICVQVARNSKCLSRQIGAILVRDKLIVATGYNGPPRGIVRCDLRDDLDVKLQEGVCPRKTMGFKSGEGLEVCVAAHAEENTILMCAREGIKCKGATMYMACGIPCKKCMIMIIQVGIKELVVTKMDTYGVLDDSSAYLLKNSNVKVRLYDFI